MLTAFKLKNSEDIIADKYSESEDTVQIVNPAKLYVETVDGYQSLIMKSWFGYTDNQSFYLNKSDIMLQSETVSNYVKQIYDQYTDNMSDLIDDNQDNDYNTKLN